MGKTVVITGSTRGIGLGLANAFLKRDCNVVVSGRTQRAIDAALVALASAHRAARVFGQPCDVTDYAQLEALWRATVTRFGKVDIWINNAGISMSRMALWDQDPKSVHDVINTNLLGVLYGCQVALKGMMDQRSGALYNLEGFGSDGMVRPGLATYGASKRAVTYLTKSLAADVRASGILVGAISPGIVATDLLTSDYAGEPAAFERAKRMFNILGDRVETVTPFLAERVLSNTKNGARIAWLTPAKVAARFATSRFRKRDIFSKPS